MREQKVTEAFEEGGSRYILYKWLGTASLRKGRDLKRINSFKNPKVTRFHLRPFEIEENKFMASLVS